MDREMTNSELTKLALQLMRKNLELEEQLKQARKREKIWYELWREKN